MIGGKERDRWGDADRKYHKDTNAAPINTDQHVDCHVWRT